MLRTLCNSDDKNQIGLSRLRMCTRRTYLLLHGVATDGRPKRGLLLTVTVSLQHIYGL